MTDGHAKWFKSTKLFANPDTLYFNNVPWQPNSNTVAPGW